MRDEEDLAKSIEKFVSLTFLPIRMAVSILTELVESIEKSFQVKPGRIASDMIDFGIDALKAINRLVEKQINILEKYKKEVVEKKEKIEKIKVE